VARTPTGVRNAAGPRRRRRGASDIGALETGPGEAYAPGTAIAIGIVGAGPRGTITLDRILAGADELAPGRRIVVHLVDPEPPGAGRVFRPGQPAELLMNTVSADVTVFTDDSVRCAGPVRPGPSQYEWARQVADGILTEDLPQSIVEEAAAMRPWSYASRAFNGHYLSWALRHVIGGAPDHVTVRVHRLRAVAAGDRADGGQWLRLEDGERLPVDALVLATGHSDVQPTAGQRRHRDFAARAGLVYVPPCSPAEADLSGIAAGEPVLLRGLGLTFFDYVTLLTAGRGGRYHRSGGRLRYLPSGAEPALWAGSRRGLPYASRPEVREEMPVKHQPRFLTEEVVAELRRDAGTGRTSFRDRLWPHIVRELHWVYYGRVLAGDPDRLQAFRDACETLPPVGPRIDAVLAELLPDPGLRWDWQALDRPAGDREFADHDDYTAWVTRRLRDDVTQSLLGPAGSARKAVAAALRDLRAPISRVVSHEGLSGRSYRDELMGWFHGLFNSVSNGPPVFRIEELAALADAGVLRFTGPELSLTQDEAAGTFAATSPAVAAGPVRARALIDARLHATDLRRTADPLLGALVAGGQARAHVIPDEEDGGYRTGGLDITEEGQRLVDASGRPHRARFAYGPPVESVQWLTATIVRPFSNSTTLQQGDLIARQALTAAVRAQDPPDEKDAQAASGIPVVRSRG
jgi:FAD-NAD(P)-binding